VLTNGNNEQLTTPIRCFSLENTTVPL
jgi:hypothetical protein